LLFPSSNSSRRTSDGRYDLYATPKHRQYAGEEGHGVQLLDTQRVKGVRRRDRGQQRRAAQVGGDHDRPPVQPVYPHPDHRSDDQLRHDARSQEYGHLVRPSVQDKNRGEVERRPPDQRPKD